VSPRPPTIAWTMSKVLSEYMTYAGKRGQAGEIDSGPVDWSRNASPVIRVMAEYNGKRRIVRGVRRASRRTSTADRVERRGVCEHRWLRRAGSAYRTVVYGRSTPRQLEHGLDRQGVRVLVEPTIVPTHPNGMTSSGHPIAPANCHHRDRAERRRRSAHRGQRDPRFSFTDRGRSSRSR
jgi:hypothetical protein